MRRLMYHGWHTFDELRGLEVKAVGDQIWLRHIHDREAVVLDLDQFDHLRSPAGQQDEGF